MDLPPLGYLQPGDRRPVVPYPAPQPLELIRGGPAAPALAQQPVDYDAAHHPRRAYAELKVDGYRCCWIDDRLVTLNGQPFNSALHCRPALEKIQREFGEPVMIDGEYLEPLGYDATAAAFRKGQGAGVFWVFDIVPLSEWMTDSCAEPYWVRKAAVRSLITSVRSEFVGALFETPVASPQSANAIFKAVRARGLEGIVVKDADAPYRRRRDRSWMRLKPNDTSDLMIVEVFGNDTSGVRKIQLRGDRGPVIVTTGWNREQALLLWSERDSLPGKIAEIEHSGLTEQGKLRHPRFGRLRFDKGTADA